MFPVYQGMNSYPYQRMPSTQYYHPSWEAVPPQMKEDSSSISCTHEPWPNNNYGYPVPPMQCHNCCTHGQHPAYYNFRPPCFHHHPPPPPPLSAGYNHFCGGYPPYPQSFPMYYAPPPHYSMELPRYEFDKSVPREQFHCCECSNHSSHVRGRNNVKIEEHEPDVETKKSESLFPAGANNFAYPIMWIPPGLTMNKEQPRKLVENKKNEQEVLPYVKKPQVQRRSVDTEARDNESSPHSRKPPQSTQSVEEDSNLGYGRWFPLDLNSIKELMKGGDATNSQDQGNRSRDEKKACDAGKKDLNKQLSYPIIWMPYDRLLKDHSKDQVEKATGENAAEESPSSLNFVPSKMEHTDNEEGKGRTVAGDNEGRIGTLGAEKKSSVKTIPVKQLEESVPKLLKEVEHKADGAHVEKVKASSPTKKSKLPPICLRVDPPKKKTGNSSSRSPSPPGGKRRQDSEESNSGGKNKQSQMEIKVKDTEEKMPNQKKIEVSHVPGVACDDEGKMMVQQADSNGTEDVKSVNDTVQVPEAQAEKESKSLQESKQERKVMSEMEAAVIIQSAYRGHDIRRWEPLKKLKQIANVREEVVQVKKKIEDLESRDAIDDKEKAVIGEAIMKLLLKLDTIQGMHQSIRDVRRPVAQELISLQEKLDSIASQKSTLLSHDTCNSHAPEETHKGSSLVEGSENIIESALEPSNMLNLDGDNIAKATEVEGISSNDFDLCASQLPHSQSGSENKETSEPLTANLDYQREPQDNVVVSDSSASIHGDVEVPGVGLEMKEKELDAIVTEQGRSPMEFEVSLVDSSPVDEALAQNDLVSENKAKEGDLLSESSEEVVENTIATAGPVENASEQNDLVAVDQDKVSLPLELPEESASAFENISEKNDLELGDKDEECLPLELPEEVVEKSLATAGPVENASEQNDLVAVDKDEVCLPLELPEESDMGSSIVNTDVQTDKVAGDEDQEADTLCELFRDVVDNEEEIVQTEHDLGSSVLSFPGVIQPHNDGKEIAEDHCSEKSNADEEMSQPCETLEACNENIQVIDHESHGALELSSLEAESNKESGSVIYATNIEIPIRGEEESKLRGSIGDEEASDVSLSVQVEEALDNKVEVMTKIQETSNVECSSETAVLTDPSGDHENVTELLTGDQENESETLKQELAVPEPEVQRSNEEVEACGKSVKDQSSVVAAQNEVQADMKVLDENEKLRELLEKLLAAGKEQQEVILSLNGKVKDLEKKLAKRKKPKSAKHSRVKVLSPSCGKPTNGSLRERPMGVAS